MSLRNRIMLLVAVGLLIATIPLGIMGLRMVRTATERILEERLAIAEATAHHLSDRIAQGWWQLDQLGAHSAVEIRRGDRAVLQADFARIVPQIPLFSGGAFLADRDGRLVVANVSSAGVLPRQLVGLAAARRAIQTGRHQTETVASGLGRPALALFAAPVFGSDGEVAGVVVGIIDLNLPTLAMFIKGLAMGTSGHAAIVARDGTVLASTETAELFTREEHPDHFAALIERGEPAVGLAEDLAGPRHHHLRHVMAFAPLEAVPWGVGIGQSEEETFGPLRHLRDRIIVFETGVLLAALALAWADTSAVIRPLRLLRRAAERIAEGDLAQQIDVHRGDEIGTLSRSFETMRVRLLGSIEENARLQERLQSVAIVEERERLAREMHDSVGQVLGYVNTKAQAVRVLLDAGQLAEADAQLTQLEEAARDVYADLRAAILSLRTATGPERRLLPALREYVDRFTEQTGVETALVVEDTASRFEFPPTVEAHLVRIVQEALTNVRKHAAAAHATVRLAPRDGVVVITIEDDGVGIAGRADGASGFGLQTMRERALAIGGMLTVTTRPAGGTSVEIVVPARKKTADARPAG